MNPEKFTPRGSFICPAIGFREKNHRKDGHWIYGKEFNIYSKLSQVKKNIPLQAGLDFAEATRHALRMIAHRVVGGYKIRRGVCGLAPGKPSPSGGSCNNHSLRDCGESRIGSGAGAGIQHPLKILDSGSRFALNTMRCRASFARNDDLPLLSKVLQEPQRIVTV